MVITPPEAPAQASPSPNVAVALSTPTNAIPSATATESTPTVTADPTVESTVTPTPPIELTATPEVSPAPIVTVAADTPTASPVATNTSDHGGASAWSQQARDIRRINGSLADAGRGYQAGTVSQRQAVAALAQADQDATAIAATAQALPPPTGTEPAAVADAQHAVATWSATLHRLHQAADNMDFFSGIPLVGQLQTDAQNLDTAIARLHLPAEQAPAAG